MKPRSIFRALSALTIFTAGAVCLSHAQISTQNSEKHSIIGARAGALGDALVADYLDATSMYWNPATLVRTRRQALNANFAVEANEFRDLLFTENLTLPLPVAMNWGLGVGLTMTHVGEIVTDSLKGLKFSILKIDLAGARGFGNFFSIGAGLAMRYAQGGGRQITAFSGTLGLFYIPNPVMSYGVSYQGLGEEVNFSVDNNTTILGQAPMQQSLQLGVAVRVRHGDYSRFTLTVVSQKILKQTGILYKAGVEVLPTSFLALRLGYWAGSNSAAARYGVGLILGDFVVDYALAPSKLEPRYHQVSLSYNLQKRTGRQ